MNIIFDAGGVLVAWKPREIAQRVYPDPDAFLKAVVKSSIWKDYDMGLCSTSELLEVIDRDTEISAETAASFIREALDSINPIPETLELVDELAEQGHKLYVLSNMPKEFAQFLEQRDAFWEKFTARVFSGYIQTAKPDKAIFDYILQTYALDVKQTLFIDDYRENTDAAQSLGFQTHLFTDARTCREQLTAMGVM